MKDKMYSPEVRLLLINQSDEKENVLYNNNPFAYQLPKIGARPPYYCYPRYEQSYPVI